MKNQILVIILLLASSQIIQSAKPENKTFIATHEWQEVQEGQQIPAGLHVRINLTSGVKEAKLLDEEEKTESAISKLPEAEHETEPLKINKELEEALKELNRSPAPMELEYSPEKKEQIKAKYRPYDELKQMRKNFQTDGEVITQLIGEYQNITKETNELKIIHDKRRQVLEIFEYMLHQIDNAIWFIDAGGLDHLLLPLVVNETHLPLRVQAMRVLGALAQNNPKAQIKVYERNFGSHLAQVLSTSTQTEELSTALYAFGALLRKFPLAQQRILSTSGTQALIAVLSKQCELKIKAKAATLISDIIVEKKFATRSDADIKSIVQYAEVDLEVWLVANGYCKTMDSLMTQTSQIELIEVPHLLEYFLQALSNTKHICYLLWTQNPQLKHQMLSLRSSYLEIADEYRTELAEQIQQLVVDLYQKGLPHEEL